MVAFRKNSQGFTLPTVLIACIIMILLLMAALQLAAMSANALRDQYYNQLAREAAEAGAVRMKACLKNSGYIPTWTAAKPLKPNTNCSGDPLPGVSLYMLEHGELKTSYSVGLPSLTAVGIQRAAVIGDVFRARSSDGQVRKLMSYNSAAGIGGRISLNAVSFGYFFDPAWCGTRGSFYVTIDAKGAAKAAGNNSCGQLGSGSFSHVITPQYLVRPTSRVARTYTNFLSLGYNLFALTESGEVWGSGRNTHGALGSGSVAEKVTVGEKFNLPSSDAVATHVAPLGDTTFVVTSNGNVYAAGSNAHGKAGIASGAPEVRTPTKVRLPERARADEVSWAVDVDTAYVITESGAVYGWGSNEFGQLAQNDMVDRNSPVRIGSFGQPGQPKAMQVATDGETLYIRDSDGNVYSAGKSSFGEAGTRTVRIKRKDINKCLMASGTSLFWRDCTPSADQEWTFRADHRIEVTANYGGGWRCIDDHLGSGRPIVNWCAAIDTNQWEHLLLAHISGWDSNAVRFRNKKTRLCLTGRDDGTNFLRGCAMPPGMLFSPFTMKLNKINFPGGRKAVDISTDQYFAAAVMTDGNVYTWGLNNGSLGNGAYIDVHDVDRYWSSIYNPDPVQFILPPGVKAINSWTTSNGWNPYYGSNVFVVTSDGRVFGSGTNSTGQLGVGFFAGGTFRDVHATPREMLVIGSGDSGAAQYVRSGYGTTVIYTSSGKVYTVGNNENGQLGDGTLNHSHTPKANIFIEASPLLLY